MYTTLPLFCGVWFPAGLCSAGSDTPQNFVKQGIRPHTILFCGVSDPADKLRPRRTKRKSVESLPFSLKGLFSKIVCMYKLHNPRHIWSMLKEPPIWKFFCVLRGLIPPQNNFEIRISPRIRTRNRKSLGYELGAHMGSIHEKNQRPKISCYCTFKQPLPVM